MSYNRLFVFVEGDDDERFFANLVVPQLQIKYNHIDIIKYASETKKKVKSFIRSIQKMSADYIIVGDINSKPCVTEKKSWLKSRINNIGDDKIYVVVQEIESWYLSGLEGDVARQLGIKFYRSANNITKEIFEKLLPDFYDSKIDFMLEVIKVYSFSEARRRNRSFNYFVSKYLERG